MAALKRSLAQEAPTPKPRTANKAKRTKEVPDRSQPALLLPLSGGRKRSQQTAAEPAPNIASNRGRKA
jgi:hypothetical protein